jgi:GNAT superfamily N-acetyltransferase
VATDVPDWVVDAFVERQLEHRLRFRYADEQAARAATRDLVERLLPDSRVELLDGDGYLWLGPDGERTPVFDLECAVEDVPRVRDLATDLAGAPLAASVLPGDPLREAFVDDGTFRRFAANLRLAVTDPLPGEELADRVQLAPMDADEFAAYRVQLKAGYAAEREAAGESRQEARRQAEEVDRDLLPGGLTTEDQFLFTATTEGRRCGVLWLCARWPAQGYVYDVEVEPDLRGRGLGAALMVHAGLWARDRGFPWLGLNVFGHNTRARSLYERLGYTVEEEHLAREL